MSRIVESLYQKYDLNESLPLTEKKWAYQLKNGAKLRKAIHDENHKEVMQAIYDCYEELKDNGLIDEDDFENYTQDFELYLYDDFSGWDDPDEIVNYELNNLYDLCDNIGVWISLNESKQSNSRKRKLTEDYYILIPTENRYDEPIDVMKFAKKYGVFKTSDEAMDKMNELAPDRWDAFITYRLEESMKDKVKNIKLNEAFFDDSSYTEPIRFKINVSSTSRDDCDKVFKRMFNDKHIIRPEILIDNEDGSGEICFPGPNDLIDFIKQCLYEVTDKPSEYKLDIL